MAWCQEEIDRNMFDSFFVVTDEDALSNGIDLLQRVKDKRPFLPVILITAYITHQML